VPVSSTATTSSPLVPTGLTPHSPLCEGPKPPFLSILHRSKAIEPELDDHEPASTSNAAIGELLPPLSIAHVSSASLPQRSYPAGVPPLADTRGASLRAHWPWVSHHVCRGHASMNRAHSHAGRIRCVMASVWPSVIEIVPTVSALFAHKPPGSS
jgi:hypothetical protein